MNRKSIKGLIVVFLVFSVFLSTIMTIAAAAPKYIIKNVSEIYGTYALLSEDQRGNAIVFDGKNVTEYTRVEAKTSYGTKAAYKSKVSKVVLSKDKTNVTFTREYYGENYDVMIKKTGSNTYTISFNYFKEGYGKAIPTLKAKDIKALEKLTANNKEIKKYIAIDLKAIAEKKAQEKAEKERQAKSKEYQAKGLFYNPADRLTGEFNAADYKEDGSPEYIYFTVQSYEEEELSITIGNYSKKTQVDLYNSVLEYSLESDGRLAVKITGDERDTNYKLTGKKIVVTCYLSDKDTLVEIKSEVVNPLLNAKGIELKLKQYGV